MTDIASEPGIIGAAATIVLGMFAYLHREVRACRKSHEECEAKRARDLKAHVNRYHKRKT